MVLVAPVSLLVLLGLVIDDEVGVLVARNRFVGVGGLPDRLTAAPPAVLALDVVFTPSDIK